jgi:hypothetical protein
VIEVALATHTAPADWRDEPDESLATALQLLADQAAEMRKATRKK